MWIITVNNDKCDGKGECVDICPVSALSIVNGKAAATNPDDCAGCMSCVETCPNGAISVTEM